MLEITSSHLSLATEGSEKEAEEKNRCVTNFDCNVCFDIAKETIVTSCGHLFCWPCLYPWLHVHSDHKECPVCKRGVNEVNITSIYGSGKLN
ncbi:E3 ubiquitin-protein ligase RMA1 [Dendrobium catenatum]|uniref:E3 ubiquitin-protein ligase RMA n=1 Tax=Dendrobium catenatum TaxID=906689 RepID=A0A2I0WHQ5_9ASPA|nr:E3 ubiquitin-protein ligase RMA1 [Dendrobium catenatum]